MINIAIFVSKSMNVWIPYLRQFFPEYEIFAGKDIAAFEYFQLFETCKTLAD